MNATPREVTKQERHRRHKRGDHSVCLPERGCQQVAASTGRGERLWSALAEAGPSTPAREALLVELARTADRLDTLHDALAKAPLSVELMREARGQQQTLSRLLAALEKATPAAPARPIRPNPLEELRREIQERKASRSAG
jgi:hypothetical protein